MYIKGSNFHFYFSTNQFQAAGYSTVQVFWAVQLHFHDNETGTLTLDMIPHLTSAAIFNTVIVDNDNQQCWPYTRLESRPILPPALFNWSCQFESAFWSRLAALCLVKCTVWAGNCGGGGASRGRWGNQATTVIVKSPPRWGESGAFILNSTVFTCQLQTQHTQSNFCDEHN